MPLSLSVRTALCGKGLRALGGTPEEQTDLIRLSKGSVCSSPFPQSLHISAHLKIKNKFKNLGWGQWLTPVIPALSESKAGASLEVRSSRPAWPTW